MPRTQPPTCPAHTSYFPSEKECCEYDCNDATAPCLVQDPTDVTQCWSNGLPGEIEFYLAPSDLPLIASTDAHGDVGQAMQGTPPSYPNGSNYGLTHDHSPSGLSKAPCDGLTPWQNGTADAIDWNGLCAGVSSWPLGTVVGTGMGQPVYAGPCYWNGYFCVQDVFLSPGLAGSKATILAGNPRADLFEYRIDVPRAQPSHSVATGWSVVSDGFGGYLMQGTGFIDQGALYQIRRTAAAALNCVPPTCPPGYVWHPELDLCVQQVNNLDFDRHPLTNQLCLARVASDGTLWLDRYATDGTDTVEASQELDAATTCGGVCVRFTPDGSLWAGYSNGTRVRLLVSRDSGRSFTLMDDLGAGNAVSFDADSTAIYAAVWDGNTTLNLLVGTGDPAGALHWSTAHVIVTDGSGSYRIRRDRSGTLEVAYSDSGSPSHVKIVRSRAVKKDGTATWG